MDRQFLCSEEDIHTESADSFMTKSIALFTQGKSLEWFYAEENFLAIPLQKARFIDWEWQVIFLFENL